MSSRITPQIPEQSLQEANLWRAFHRSFQALTDKQREVVRTMRKGDRRLRASWVHNSDVTLVKPELIAEQGFAPYKFDLGTWRLGEGPNQNLKARFQSLASRAGLALHPPLGSAPLDFWLHSLYLHLQDSNGGGFFLSATGVYVEDICEESATFCSWLEKKALETSAAAVEKERTGDRRLKSTISNPSAAKRMEEGSGS